VSQTKRSFFQEFDVFKEYQTSLVSVFCPQRIVWFVCTDRTTRLNCGVHIRRLHSSAEHKFANSLYQLNGINRSLNNSVYVCKQQSMNNYLRLQVIQSKCLWVIGNHPRRTPNSHLHNSLHVQPIPFLFHRFTDKFFAHYPSHPHPPPRPTKKDHSPYPPVTLERKK